LFTLYAKRMQEIYKKINIFTHVRQWHKAQLKTVKAMLFTANTGRNPKCLSLWIEDNLTESEIIKFMNKMKFGIYHVLFQQHPRISSPVRLGRLNLVVKMKIRRLTLS